MNTDYASEKFLIAIVIPPGQKAKGRKLGKKGMYASMLGKKGMHASMLKADAGMKSMKSLNIKHKK